MRTFPVLLGGFAGLAVAAAAMAGSGTVEFQAMSRSLRYRVTLGSYFGEYSVDQAWPQAGQAMLSMSVEFDQEGRPSGLVIDQVSGGLSAPHMFGVSIAPFGSVIVTLSAMQFSAPAQGLIIPVDESGTFAANVLGGSVGCHLSYATHGTQCGQLLGSGSICEFSGQVSAPAVPMAATGSIFREPFEADWSFELHLALQSPIHAQDPEGDSVEIWATLRGTISEFSAVCPEDWDGDQNVTVQDIFVFLTDWFAGEPSAQMFGGTQGVSAIFAFLTAWFAHAPGPC